MHLLLALLVAVLCQHRKLHPRNRKLHPRSRMLRRHCLYAATQKHLSTMPWVVKSRLCLRDRGNQRRTYLRCRWGPPRRCLQSPKLRAIIPRCPRGRLPRRIWLRWSRNPMMKSQRGSSIRKLPHSRIFMKYLVCRPCHRSLSNDPAPPISSHLLPMLLYQPPVRLK